MAEAPPGMNHVEITGKYGPDAKITVDGHLLACSRAVMTWDAESLPELVVALPVADGFVVTLEAIPSFAEETRAALVAMGWTPPKADTGHAEIMSPRWDATAERYAGLCSCGRQPSAPDYGAAEEAMAAHVAAPSAEAAS